MYDVSLWFLCHAPQFLVNRARDLAQRLIANIVAQSRTFNQSICHQYDVIVRRITAQSETTEALVKQQEYVEALHVGELLELKVRQQPWALGSVCEKKVFKHLVSETSGVFHKAKLVD